MDCCGLKTTYCLMNWNSYWRSLSDSMAPRGTMGPLGYVTPAQRHNRTDKEILAKRGAKKL